MLMQILQGIKERNNTENSSIKLVTVQKNGGFETLNVVVFWFGFSFYTWLKGASTMIYKMSGVNQQFFTAG